MGKIEWIIELIGNGVRCAQCGRIENPFPQFICNAHMVEGIFLDCPIRLDEVDESGRKVLRIVIPDGKNRFPEDADCEYPYNFELLPTDALEQNTICT